MGESEASLGWTVLGSKWRKPAAQSRMEGRERHTEKGSGLRLKNIKDLLRSDSADKENSKKWRQGEEGQESISLKYKCTGTHLPVLPQPVSAAKTSASNIVHTILRLTASQLLLQPFSRTSAAASNQVLAKKKEALQASAPVPAPAFASALPPAKGCTTTTTKGPEAERKEWSLVNSLWKICP